MFITSTLSIKGWTQLTMILHDQINYAHVRGTQHSTEQNNMSTVAITHATYQNVLLTGCHNGITQLKHICEEAIVGR